nr:hypothetical protein [Tanacetum cinerariifolium]
VKCLRSKDEAPDFIIKFLKMIQVRLKVGISNETSVARSPQQNGVVERRNRTLIEAARTMERHHMSFCIINLPDLSFLHVFGALCYPTNDSENLGKLQLKADIGIFIGYTPTKKAFQIYNRRSALNEMTPTIISSGLMQKPSSLTPYVPPSRNDWDLLFQPLFDELLTPPPSVNPQAPEVIAPIADVIPPVQAELTGSPFSTTVDQDAPSASKSHTTPETQSFVIPQDVEEDIHDIDVAHMGNDLLFGVPIPEVTSAQSSSTSSSRLALHEMTPTTISSGLVQKSSSSTTYVPPSRNDWDLLFQSMFDELLNPPLSVDHQAPKVIAPIDDVIPSVQDDSTGLPSSTTVDQDAPSTSKSNTTTEIQSSVIPQEVEEENLDIEVAHMGNDLLLGRRIVETIHVDFDELTAMASEQSSSGPALNEMTPGIISSGLVQKPSSSASYVPPSRNDWDLLFQPLFDELLNPPPSVDNQAAEVIAPIAEVIPQVNDDSTSSPSSTTVDQDAPSPSKSPTPTEIQSSVILQDVGNDNLDIEVAHMGNDPVLGVPIQEVTSEQSSSTASP